MVRMKLFYIARCGLNRVWLGLVLCWLPLAINAALLEQTIARIKPASRAGCWR